MGASAKAVWWIAMGLATAFSVRRAHLQLVHKPSATEADVDSSAPDVWAKPRLDLDAMHRHPGLSALIQRVDGEPELVATLLDPEQTEALQARCPLRVPALVLLCEPEPLAPLVAEVEQVLVDALGDEDDAVALWAVELLIARGERGAELATEALLAQDAAGLLERQQALAIPVLASTLPAAQVAPVLTRSLDSAGPVASMSALELARLNHSEAEDDLRRTGLRLADSADGLLVSHALDLLESQSAESP